MPPLCFFLFSQEEEEHAGVDSELDESGSEVDEEQLKGKQMELTENVMEKKCPTCKGSATPPLASGNKGNQQPSAFSCEEVLYIMHFTGNQSSFGKLSEANLLGARLGSNSND